MRVVPKTSYCGVACGLVLCAMPVVGRADLNDSNFVAATHAYDMRDCEGTLKYLAIYRQRDAAFLASNPQIDVRIRQTERFCAEHLRGLRTPSESVTVGGQGAPPPFPVFGSSLPEVTGAPPPVTPPGPPSRLPPPPPLGPAPSKP